MEPNENHAPARLIGWFERPWPWIAFALVAYGPWIKTNVGRGNVASDLAAIESLVERRTFFINDSTYVDTIDKFKRDDHFFSQKSPVFHLIAAVPYGVMHAAGFTLRERPGPGIRAITLFMVVMPMGALLWLMYRHPWARRWDFGPRVALVLAFAFGSLLTPFALTLNHYIPAAACLMAAVNLLTHAVEAEKPIDSKRGILIGFWIAASLACDVPPAFLFGCGVAAWFAIRGRPALGGLALGAAPLIVLYSALNWFIVGSPLPPNMNEEAMLYYEGSYWTELRDKAEAGNPGYYQASYPRRLFHATVGHKGIYWMTPLLALATLRALAASRRREGPWGLAAAWAAFPPITIAVTMIWAFDLSGGAYGIRHAFASLPPLFCTLAYPVAIRSPCAFSSIAGAAGAWGVAVAAIGAINPWSANTLSAFPPIENIARYSLRHADRVPVDWIPRAIELTSVKPANAWLDLGLEHLNAGRLPAAEHALTQAVAEDPRVPIHYYHLGIVQDMRGTPWLAIATYEKLLEIDPDNVGGWNNLGIFRLRAGLRDLAKEAFTESWERSGGHPTAAWGLLTVEEIAGRSDPASPLLAEALGRWPGDERLQALAERWGAPRPSALERVR